ncbi:cation:proton antiporter [Ponticoccus sp. SC2-23]|uniref:cation:proton antiporter n=1 Tax=Alexandriicola marinus TaxID=2081710 RepID=UPI000FDB1515|nr:cation:proton antiporter family protein [Alexandriicola marinus]MBM1218890.1 cation:proton antiporter [Ponticoccus sp. SC6-9]MBM1224038.1 cation:proton antiporter [Ponticoccus sp. SC6-15]MBM1230183.1 cation:proton antiporter [Ponticoccus sp. SC6-38]MBM1233004.1 cation:proton antiporter [Ponticoccus sp. SC6-45]MBM1237046.1 cation:proton antiporter [Ponticoccus sp. SC6-49]MBM1242015.1 cation:proton antiporter [Ponticoccus sp. SC2-64]MBM1246528.1 cation:proton antiporter [Ponticoccus sp. SC6
MTTAIESYIFYEIAALLVLAAGVGFVGLLLRQPLIVSFIAVGIIAGPSVLDIARSDEQIDLLAELGIAVLLFLVGLKLDFNLVRTLGPVALVTGIGQVLFTTVFGFLIGLALGLSALVAIYVAIALTFSSTIIIVKLLSDKREIDALHGRIALGFLIVQDIVVVVAMIALSAIGVGGAAAGDENAMTEVMRVLGYGIAMLAFVVFFIRYVASPLVETLSKAPELLVSFAIGWAALLAAIGHYLGFGKELGGLLAGVSLASTPFREAIAARLASLRDFLLLFFFIALGASLDLSALGASIGPAIVLSLFVLIGNPLIVLAIMGAMGYRKRTGFLAGLTVAQISEFSLIFMAMGVAIGHVTEEALGLVTLVGLVTIAASTYMITYSHQLYAVFEPVLGIFERRHPEAEDSGSSDADQAYDAILFGLGRYGLGIASELRDSGKRILGVDFSPEAVRFARGQGFEVLFGDATDPEFLGHLPLGRTEWLVMAVPEHDTGLTHDDPRHTLLRGARALGFTGKIAVAAHRSTTAEKLQAEQAELVLMPYRDAAFAAARMIAGDAPVPAVAVETPSERL